MMATAGDVDEIRLEVLSHEDDETPDANTEEQIMLEILQNLPSRQPLQKLKLLRYQLKGLKARKRRPGVPEILLTPDSNASSGNDPNSFETEFDAAISDALHDLDLSVKTLDRRRKKSSRKKNDKQVVVDIDHREEEAVVQDIREFAIEQELLDLEQFDVKPDVRTISTSLQYKKSFREYLHQREQSMSEAPKWEKTWKKTKQYWVDWSPKYEFWKDAFKQIEGRHGAAACAYFRFLKWLFFMNLFVTIFIAGVFIIPHEVLKPDDFQDTFPSNANLSVEIKAADICSKQYEDDLKLVVDDESVGSKIVSFFVGEGWLERTTLFLGYYFDKVYYYGKDGNDDSTDVVYNTAVGYLLMNLAYFLVLLIVMVVQTGNGLRDKLVSGNQHNKYCVKIFTAWDFSLSSKKAAEHRHKNINIEFKNDLVVERQRKEKQAMSYGHLVCLNITRVLIWILVLASWAGAFYLIIKVVGDWTVELMKKDTVKNNDFLTLVVQYLPSITLTVLNVVLPTIFYKIVEIEHYTPETEIKITLARTVILRLASVAVLAFSLHSQLKDCGETDDSANILCGNCQDTTSCWETYVGQQFYRLVMLDFFIIVAIAVFVILPRRLFVDKFGSRFKVVRFIDRQEFEIPIQILELVYSQTISWIGGFFSPLIPLITVIKFIIFFYVKKWTLLCNCVFAAKPYRASKSNYFFMIILLLAYILSVLSISYAIGRINPSQSCGPWRVYEEDYADDYFMYQSISAGVKDLPSAARWILRIISNWILYLLLLVILCLVIYYNYAMTAGSKRRIQLLKYQLALEGQDRQFLMKEVNRVIASQGLLHRPSLKQRHGPSND